MQAIVNLLVKVTLVGGYEIFGHRDAKKKGHLLGGLFL